MTKLLKPPAGFDLAGTSKARVLTIKPEKYAEPLDKKGLGALYGLLAEWATDNSLRIEPHTSAIVGYGGWAELHAWTSFTLTPTDEPLKHNVRVFSGEHKCAYCDNATIALGELFCGGCEQFQICSNCRIAGTQLFKGMGTKAGAFCAKCCAVCVTSGCDEVVPPNSGSDKCIKCEPRGTCKACAQIKPSKDLEQFKAANTKGRKLPSKVDVCKACAKAFICGECQTYRGNHQQITAQVHPITKKDIRMCTACLDELYAKHAETFEAWEKHEMPTSGNLIIPTTDDRPVRTISFELEFDGNGGQCAKALHRAGLIPGPAVGGRHLEQGDNGSRHPCLLKHDGSVSGGELVAFLLNLDDPKHAAALQRTTEVMRAMAMTGNAEFSTRAGGHVHYDLHGYGLRDCWNCYTVFMYLQDTLYHLAGAGSDSGHRSLNGNNYAPPPLDGPFGSLEHFASSMKSTDGFGRGGLHFSNYSRALRNCGCGAQMTGRWEACTCDLGKATAEWRLWNANITPRILHAWLSLAMSITAYAQDNEDMDEGDFPYFVWGRKATIGTTEKAKHKERLEWIHRELPLTTHERDSIVYAAKQSHLKVLGDEYLDSLLKITSNADKARKEKKKPPKRPSSQRKTNLEVQKVTQRELASVGAVDGVDLYDDDYDDGSADW